MNENAPLTGYERDFAETHIGLVDRFLRVKRLSPDEYWDIAVMGYLRAVRAFHRLPVEEERQNFPALARICMERAVYDHWRREGRQKRHAEVLSLDYLASSTEDDDFSLYAVLFDERQDVARLFEARELLARAHARGNRRELAVMDLIAGGCDIEEAAQALCVSVRKCRALLRSIRAKTEAAKAEYRGEERKRGPRKHTCYTERISLL